MRKSEMMICEDMLRDYGEMKRTLIMIERASLCGAPDNERVSGGSALPCVARMSEYPMRADIISATEAIASALCRLDLQTRAIVVRVYMQRVSPDELCGAYNVDARTLRRWCNKAVEIMSEELLPLAGIVSRWRRVWQAVDPAELIA